MTDYCALPQLIQTRSSYDLAQSILSRTQDELNKSIELLRAYERKVERDRSSTVRKLEKRTESVSGIEKISTAATPPVHGIKREDSGDDEDRQEGSSGLSRTEIQELQILADARLKESEELRNDRTALRGEVDDLKVKVSQASYYTRCS